MTDFTKQLTPLPFLVNNYTFCGSPCKYLALVVAVSAGLPRVGGGAGRGEGGAAVCGDVEDGGQPQVLQTQAQEGRHQVR